jgi:hypothetical protein
LPAELPPPLGCAIEEEESVKSTRIGARSSESYMIKPGKFWSNYAEDILFISLLMIGILAVYLFAAYIIIAVL